MAVLLCFLLGFVTGLRSMTAPAIVCWAARFGWLHFSATKLAFIAHPATLIIFTLLAIGELTADKLPNTPARTAPIGLTARIIVSCLCCIAVALSTGGSFLVLPTVGVIGSLAGTFAGYNARRALVLRAHLSDFAVALAEDGIAIAGGLLIVSHF